MCSSRTRGGDRRRLAFRPVRSSVRGAAAPAAAVVSVHESRNRDMASSVGLPNPGVGLQLAHKIEECAERLGLALGGEARTPVVVYADEILGANPPVFEICRSWS